jgi:hypothetical protein
MTSTKISSTLFILGAPDPEMELIEKLAPASRAMIGHASVDGVRVHPGNAYRADGFIPAGPVESFGRIDRVVTVECGAATGRWFPAIDEPEAEVIAVDHHRPGDPGYGRPPEEFLGASSVGQVFRILTDHATYPTTLPRGLELVHDVGGAGLGYVHFGPHWGRDVRGRWANVIGISHPGDEYAGIDPSEGRAVIVPDEIVLAAAADHCLAHAYAGRCPGVDPEALMRWRAESRAAFQKRSIGEVLADVAAAREVLRAAPKVLLWQEAVPTYGDGFDSSDYSTYTAENLRRRTAYVCHEVSDLRGRHVPELPEASAREGIAFLADGLPDRDGRMKVVIQSAPPETVRAFLEHWAPANRLVDTYGDPARGFAGGYLP